jgi:hypothetical protein
MVEANGSFPIGAKEAWLERMEFLNMDLTWLLEIKQFRYVVLLRFSRPMCNLGCALKVLHSE